MTPFGCREIHLERRYGGCASGLDGLVRLVEPEALQVLDRGGLVLAPEVEEHRFERHRGQDLVEDLGRRPVGEEIAQLSGLVQIPGYSIFVNLEFPGDAGLGHPGGHEGQNRGNPLPECRGVGLVRLEFLPLVLVSPVLVAGLDGVEPVSGARVGDGEVSRLLA
ncbi:hypothetical protein LCGC14_1740710 [marine sediment metagenome]|uniref:Uncharacterized protein n=1 Tax=marine sediment metagenome TaxID=412755 RepID=A0A0F9H6T0_9ZZZZ